MIPTILFLIYCLYGSVFWVIYFIIFVQMIRPANRKEFSTSFFVIAKVIAFMDLTSSIVFFVTFKVPLTPLFGHYFANIPPTYIWSAPYFYALFAEYVRPMLVLASALNRFTALAIPTKHERFWRKWIIVVMGVAFGVPLLLNWQVLVSRTYTIPFNLDSDVAWSIIREKLPWYFNNYNSFVLSVYYIVIGSTTLIINMACLLKLRLMQLQKSTGTDEQRAQARRSMKRAEIGLIAVSCGDTIFMSMLATIQFILFSLEIQQLWYDPLYDTMYLLIPWVTDAVRFSRPILLLFMSKSVRELFFGTFGHKLQYEATKTGASSISVAVGMTTTTTKIKTGGRSFHF